MNRPTKPRPNPAGFLFGQTARAVRAPCPVEQAGRSPGGMGEDTHLLNVGQMRRTVRNGSKSARFHCPYVARINIQTALICSQSFASLPMKQVAPEGLAGFSKPLP